MCRLVWGSPLCGNTARVAVREWTVMEMDDLVKRSDAVHAIHERIKQIGKDKDPYVLSIRQSVREIPAVDAVEVVRCGECKHYNAGFECLIEGYGIVRSRDWFCADGERRDDATD